MTRRIQLETHQLRVFVARAIVSAEQRIYQHGDMQYSKILWGWNMRLNPFLSTWVDMVGISWDWGREAKTMVMESCKNTFNKMLLTHAAQYKMPANAIGNQWVSPYLHVPCLKNADGRWLRWSPWTFVSIPPGTGYKQLPLLQNITAYYSHVTVKGSPSREMLAFRRTRSNPPNEFQWNWVWTQDTDFTCCIWCVHAWSLVLNCQELKDRITPRVNFFQKSEAEVEVGRRREERQMEDR